MKQSFGSPMKKLAKAKALEGYGLFGDVNACTFSPRQVLLVNRRVVKELSLVEADLRGNLFVDSDVDSLASGTILTVGQDVRLRITIPCEPCSKLEKIRLGLVRETHQRRGVLARVLTSGNIELGMTIAIESESLRPLPEEWQPRVHDIVAQIPRGKVLTYARLATMAGLQSTYCRAIPGALKRRAASHSLEIHRVVPANVDRVSGVSKSALANEGVDLNDLASCLWTGTSYYEHEESVIPGSSFAKGTDHDRLDMDQL